MSFLKKYFDECKELIENSFQCLGAIINEIKYTENGNHGSGIYVLTTEDGEKNNYFYLDKDCTTREDFLKDFNTDFGMMYLNKSYKIYNHLKQHPDSNLVVSWHTNEFKGHKGLNTFWNPMTSDFDFQKFSRFCADVNSLTFVEIKRGASKGVETESPKLATLPEGTVSLPNKANVQKYLQETKEEKQDEIDELSEEVQRLGFKR